jgi:hypothetical protein
MWQLYAESDVRSADFANGNSSLTDPPSGHSGREEGGPSRLRRPNAVVWPPPLRSAGYAGSPTRQDRWAGSDCVRAEAPFRRNQLAAQLIQLNGQEGAERGIGRCHLAVLAPTPSDRAAVAWRKDCHYPEVSLVACSRTPWCERMGSVAVVCRFGSSKGWPSSTT